MTVTDEQCEAVITTRAQFFMAKRAHEEAREAGKEWADETAHQAAKEKAYEEAYDEELAEARATVKEKRFCCNFGPATSGWTVFDNDWTGSPSCPATIRSNGVSSNQDSSSCVFGGTCGMP